MIREVVEYFFSEVGVNFEIHIGRRLVLSVMGLACEMDYGVDPGNFVIFKVVPRECPYDTVLLGAYDVKAVNLVMIFECLDKICADKPVYADNKKRFHNRFQSLLF